MSADIIGVNQKICVVSVLLKKNTRWKMQVYLPLPHPSRYFPDLIFPPVFKILILTKTETMTLESKIAEGIKEALRGKDEAALRTLRAIKAAILNEKTAVGAKESLTEADELKLLQKMAKQRKDSLEIFAAQNRDDLAQKEREELEIIARFLPRPMSQEELQEALKDIIKELGATSPADMGKVMGAASKKLAGKADGKAISENVKMLLAKQ